jgi:hypothetical protein
LKKGRGVSNLLRLAFKAISMILVDQSGIICEKDKI